MKDARFAKSVVLVNGLVPLAILVWDGARGSLGANPVEFVLHTTGTLALVFLTLTLAVTPVRKLTGWHFLSHFRRLLGLFAFFYGFVHLCAYTVFGQGFSIAAIIKDTIEHPYVLVGMLAFILMIPLAITSTNAAIKRMGAKQWRLLHRLAYVSALAGVVHYWMLVKADLTMPLAFGVVIGALLVARVIEAVRPRRTPSRVSSTTA
jgi:sulfoxide reductase heme-binding subunit YedZ